MEVARRPGLSQENLGRVNHSSERLDRIDIHVAHPLHPIRKHCALDDSGERTLELAVRRMSLSARAHDRILKVARTIADLEAAESLTVAHLAEAIQYRTLDRSYWA